MLSARAATVASRQCLAYLTAENLERLQMRNPDRALILTLQMRGLDYARRAKRCRDRARRELARW